MSSSSSYNQLDRLRIPYDDIVSATDNFSVANLIRRGGFGNEYKGKLRRSGKLIDIVARRLDRQCGHGKKEFYMEVMMLSTLKHGNLVSIIGFCDEGDVKIIINKLEANGSLDQYLGDPETLTWKLRLEICMGMARALSYIHYDKRRNFSVVHRNIKSSKILLDADWKPKLSGFELSMKTTKIRRRRLLLGGFGGTIGYIDPIYEKTGRVTHKSDVYSLGVVLFEVLCGRTALFDPEEFSAQLVKQDPQEESHDIVEIDDQIVEHVGRKIAKQHSTEGSPDVVESLEEECSLQPSNKQGIKLGEGLSQQLDKQHSTEGSAHVLERLDGEPANQGSTQGYSGPLLRWSSVGNLSESLEEERSLQPSNKQGIKLGEGLSQQLDKQHSTEGSADVLERLDGEPANQGSTQGYSGPLLRWSSVGNLSESLEEERSLQPSNKQGIKLGEGLSQQLDKQHSTEGSADVLERLDGEPANQGSTQGYSGPLLRWSSVGNLSESLEEERSLQPSNKQGIKLGEGLSQQLDKQHSTEGSANVLERLDGEPANQGSTQGYSGPLLRWSSVGNLSESLEEERSLQPSNKQGIKLGEGLSQQLDKQHSTEGSADVLERLDGEPANQGSTQGYSGPLLRWSLVGNLSESLEEERSLQPSNKRGIKLGEGLSQQLDKQHSTEGSADVLERLDGEPANQGSTQGYSSPLLRWSLVGNLSELMAPSLVGIRVLPTSSEYISPELEEPGTGLSALYLSSIRTEGLWMFTAAPSARYRPRDFYIPDHELAPLAISAYEQGKLHSMIDPDLWKQVSPQSFEVFSETAYYCLKEQWSERPDIDQIIVRLERVLDLQKEYDNPEPSEGRSTKHLKGKNLKHFEIPLSEIKSATMNFDKTCLLGAGAYGDVYNGELDHLDLKNVSPLEDKNIGELPKIHSTVAIKRIKIREDNQGQDGFLAEIQMLTSCNHPNIVSLLGFCEEGDHMILVYEHAFYGSLDKYLGSAGSLTNLTWMQRIKICIDIARGLNYLHTQIGDEQKIIHRDIKSGNILLGKNWEAKIADFGLSKFCNEDHQANKTLYAKSVAGTDMYLDPEYANDGKLKNETDIYSFGVVLFEMMAGKFVDDPIFTNENSNGIAPVARRRFEEGRNSIKEMVDPRLMEETHENMFSLNKGPDQDSLYTFSKIAYECVAETQAKRPTAETIVKKLEEALSFHENSKDNLRISLEDIISATDNFSNSNFIGRGGFGRIYKGEVTQANVRRTIAAKRLDKTGGQGEIQFLTELEILWEYRHENVIGLVGYCDEPVEKIIGIEYASKGSLDTHLKNNDLTWMKRLGICIDIAIGLGFLHSGGVTKEVVIHRDLKSSNILLTDDWKAKISDFGLSIITPIDEETDFVIDDACGTVGYCDPLYEKSGFLTKESDIYSLGVVLSEILLGRLVYEKINGSFQNLSSWFRRHYEDGEVDKIVFEGIKDQIAPQSLTTFQKIAYQCLQYEKEKRPTTSEVRRQLEKALEFQEDYDIWEPKLPKDYEKIIEMTDSPKDYSNKMKKDLHIMLSKGILVQKGTVLFSLDDNGEKREMISARKFPYRHRWSHKWRSVPGSRFDKVAEMLDISNLRIQIKIKPQFLSPSVNYGVHLVFRFCGPRKSLDKHMYVNLKYRKGSETLNTHFATWREDGWMMIELCQFLNHEKDTEFEFSLESFSQCYCENRGVHIEGIEFRAIDNVKHEESKFMKEVKDLKSNLNMNQVKQLASRLENYGKSEKLFSRKKVNTKEHYRHTAEEALYESSQKKVNKKEHYRDTAKEALYESSDVKLFNSKISALYRFQEFELGSQQVFSIKCEIESRRLSRDTEYTCYLVFKLSEKCLGLHCPVIVRDFIKCKNKEKGILYFRSPIPCNINATDRAPKERQDGWMEVSVWQFNSSNELRGDCVSINLKLISYEGTMSGLIVSSLEFRPM